MTNVIVTVRAASGASIIKTVPELIELAKKLEMPIECMFNGVPLMVGPYSDEDEVVDDYWKRLRQ